jgi:hypothetical protein
MIFPPAPVFGELLDTSKMGANSYVENSGMICKSYVKVTLTFFKIISSLARNNNKRDDL